MSQLEVLIRSPPNFGCSPAVSLLATEDELKAITTVDQALVWAGLKPAVWQVVDEELREVPTLRVSATLHKDQIPQATGEAKVAVTTETYLQWRSAK